MFDRIKRWREQRAFQRKLRKFEQAEREYSATLALFREGEINRHDLAESYAEYQEALQGINWSDEMLFYESRHKSLIGALRNC